MVPNISSTKKTKSEFLKPRICRDRIKYTIDETSKAVIPVGPRYQADVPEWTGQIQKDDPDDSKWSGTHVWQPKYATPDTAEEDEKYTIGNGRPNSCSCSFSGSAECVKLHVRDKNIQLMSDLGPAFKKWRFHEMGDAFRDSWEEKKFHSLFTRRNMRSKRTSFLKLVLSHLPPKCRESVVRYYFNVYVPRRISMKIRSGALEVDSDED